MNDLIVFLARLGSMSVNVFWVPVVTWTVLVVVVLVILRFYRDLHPLVHCDVRSALLLALPSGILLASLIEGPFSVRPAADSVLYETIVMVSESSAPAIAGHAPHSVQELPVVPPPLELTFWLGLVMLVAAFVAVVMLLMLVRDALALRRFRRSLRWVEWEDLARHVSVHLHCHRTRYAISEDETVPMTFGFLRPVVVLPAYLLSQPHELQMALQHEQIHVRRRHYLWQWIEQIIAAMFAVHPVTGLLRRQIDEYREQACDAEVLADPESSPEHYARLLYEVVATRSRVIRPGLQMAGSRTNLKTRIKAMEFYPKDQGRLHRVRRLSSTIGAVLLVATISALAACDLTSQTETDVRPTVPQVSSQRDGKVRPIVFEKMTVTVDGKDLGIKATIRGDSIEKFYLHTREYGLFVFSLMPFEGAKKAGEIAGSDLRFEVGGHALLIQSTSPILGGARSPIYARYDPTYRAEQLEDIGKREGGSGRRITNKNVRLGSVALTEALYEKSNLPRQPGIRFKEGTISYNGVTLPVNGGASVEHLSGFLQLYRRGYGRITFSGVEFPEARQVAHVEGNVLRAKMENLDLVIKSELPILSSDRGVLWMRYEPDYRPKRDVQASFRGAEEKKYLDLEPEW